MTPTADRLQVQRLLAVEGVSETFHPPIVNNYVHLLVPRRVALQPYLRAIAERTMPLNRADEGLLACLTELAADRPDVDVADGLERWRECHRRRVNLRSIEHAARVVARFDAVLPEGVVAWLRREHPDVLARFVDVPRSELARIRINAYLELEALEATLATITAALCEPALDAAVDRIEIARLAPNASASSIEFPTLIVYLQPELAVPARTVCIARLASILSAARSSIPVRRQYAYVLTSNATVTQGYTLYKRYLTLVGLLDEVYEPADDHAFVRGERPAGGSL